MALKDWKQIKSTEWNRKYAYSVYNNIDFVKIMNHDPNDKTRKYSVVILNHNKKSVRYFKTKTEALKFARAYMKKH